MSNLRKKVSQTILLLLLLATTSHALAQQKDMLIRMAEIEINPDNLEEYKAILKEEAENSVRLEKGVISIFPMYEKEAPAQIRILEIYAGQEAYEAHLKTPHFLHYKASTLHMVKSLKLITLDAIDKKTMKKIFRKMKNNTQ